MDRIKEMQTQSKENLNQLPTQTPIQIPDDPNTDFNFETTQNT